MQEIRLTSRYTARNQGAYVHLPIEVAEGIQRIEISYSYPRFEEIDRRSIEINVIDLGLLDPDGLLCGWSGSERLEVFVSEARSTPGYRRMAIKPGTWHIILGLYKICGEVEIETTIRLIEKKRIRLKGDLHTHTINSDGVFTTAEQTAHAKAAGLDFIALTDHNNTAQNTEIGAVEGLTVLPGMEYTNYKGHANFLFRDDGLFFENPLSNTFEEARSVFHAAKARGAVICLNHILDRYCPWNLGWDLPYDLVEVWNGFPKESDLQAIAWWHEQLCAGRKIPAVGGSDNHRIGLGQQIGMPTTVVHALSTGRSDILDALVEGRAYIALTPESPMVEMTIGEKSFGETVPFADDLKGIITITGVKAEDRIVLLSDQGEESRWICERDGFFETRFAVNKRLFYRLELYRFTVSVHLLEVVTNPVYLS